MNPVNYSAALSLAIYLEGQLKRLYAHIATIPDIDEIFATFAAYCAEREEGLLAHRAETVADLALAPAVRLDLADFQPEFRSEPADRRSAIAQAIILEANAAHFYSSLCAALTIPELRELFEALATNNEERLAVLCPLVEPIAELPDLTPDDLPDLD